MMLSATESSLIYKNYRYELLMERIFRAISFGVIILLIVWVTFRQYFIASGLLIVILLSLFIVWQVQNFTPAPPLVFQAVVVNKSESSVQRTKYFRYRLRIENAMSLTASGEGTSIEKWIGEHEFMFKDNLAFGIRVGEQLRLLCSPEGIPSGRLERYLKR